MRSNSDEKIDAAMVGKMFVTNVSFQWHAGGNIYDSETGKYKQQLGHWQINAKLSSKPEQYADGQTMTLNVEQGIGQKLAEVLLPVIIADASKKAQELADESKAMLVALGERAQLCITAMPTEEQPQQ